MTSVLAELRGTARRRRLEGRLSQPRGSRFPILHIVWRQHWMALSVLLALSATAIAALAVSERRLSSIRGAWGPHGLWNASTFHSAYGPSYPDLAVQAIPLVAALFVGVPLIARELEDGTAGFAWTQGYGKTRWVLGKLGAAATVLVPAAVALGLVFGWWYRLYTPAIGYFTMHAFALFAPALAGWTIAGLALGMTAAAVTRRQGRAMWVTLAGWIVLHHFAIIGSPGTAPGDFWPLQFAQLAILLAISALLTVGTIAAIQGAPVIPGMPRLLRALPGRAAPDARVLARRLTGRRLMSVPRGACRQHAVGLLVALGLLGLYVATLVITGLHIHAEPARLRPQYADLTGPYQPGGPTDASYLLPLLLPFLIGAFVGGSLTGPDLDRGTVKFAWTQGVTSTRWAAAKLAAVGFVLAAAAVVAGLVFQWWDQPYLAARLTDPWFALYAPVYAGWMAVNVTAAAFFGTLTRSRTGAAVICLICTLMTAVANGVFLRSSYLPAGVAVNRPAPPGSLLLNYYVRHVQKVPQSILNRAVLNFDSTAGWKGIEQTLAKYHATNVLIFQPASQFWQLQAIESAALLAVALLFGAAAVWRVRRQES
jgi:ABC-type transport system involved in multi-copper enzyme maturation permease subunit